MWTTRGQKEAEAVLEWNLGEGRHYLKSKISYSDMSRRFYGLGPRASLSREEVVRPETTLGYVEFFRRFTSRFQAGLRYEYEQIHYLELEPQSLLETESAKSAGGGRVSGGGLIFDFDTRDRRHSPTGGVHYQAFGLIFDDAFGSRFDFNNYNVDLSSYLRLGERQVLAAQAFMYDVRGGGAPVWRMAELGGRSHTRGYRRGRYTDRLLVAVQAEYRMDVGTRWGFVGFLGAGNVAGDFDRLQVKYVRPTAGSGIRMRLTDDHLKARFDVAFGQESPRFYFGLDEAF
jgi:outer membrane protein assembly factor BamA